MKKGSEEALHQHQKTQSSTFSQVTTRIIQPQHVHPLIPVLDIRNIHWNSNSIYNQLNSLRYPQLPVFMVANRRLPITCNTHGLLLNRDGTKSTKSQIFFWPNGIHHFGVIPITATSRWQLLMGHVLSYFDSFWDRACAKLDSSTQRVDVDLGFAMVSTIRSYRTWHGDRIQFQSSEPCGSTSTVFTFMMRPTDWFITWNVSPSQARSLVVATATIFCNDRQQYLFLT